MKRIKIGDPLIAKFDKEGDVGDLSEIGDIFPFAVLVEVNDGLVKDTRHERVQCGERGVVATAFSIWNQIYISSEGSWRDISTYQPK
jgi:hypothetical protein